MTTDFGDWLGLRPFFYDESSPDSSYSFLEKDRRPNDPLGLELYLQNGFSVLGRTAFQGIRFRHPDFEPKPVGLDLNNAVRSFPSLASSEKLSELEIPWAIREHLNRVLSKNSNQIVLPLSGGYDSRLILWALRDQPRERIKTFSYGVSSPQKSSREVVVAKEMARREGVAWKQIKLGNFNEHWERWFKIMGPFSHAHGMYHIEFFDQISELVGEIPTTLLSGLVGDLFSGGVNVPKIRSIKDFRRLTLSHGLDAQRAAHLSVHSEGLVRAYLSDNAEALEEEPNRIIELVRNKMMLLRYLVDVPASFGWQICMPFIEPKIALSMLSLSKERRRGRLWQKEFFESQGLGVNRRSVGTTSNSLTFQSIIQSGERIPSINQQLKSAPKALATVANRKLEPTKVEQKFVLSHIGGSYKSALANLYGPISRTLETYKARQILFPLSFIQK